jgi:hypothetical protein
MANNETFGMSCEEAFCRIFKSNNQIEKKRVDENTVNKIQPIIDKFIKENNVPNLLYTGRNGNSADFKDENKKTYSLKSNKNGNKVCPQNIGQISRKKFTENVYYKLTDEDDPDYILENDSIKEFILKHPKKLFKLYYKNLFCCDNLIHIKTNKKTVIDITFVEKIKLPKLSNDDFIFSKNINNWNESNTLKVKIDKFLEDYKNNDIYKKYITKTENNSGLISIGEFQIHKNRNCIKFRFDIKKLKILSNLIPK